MTDRIVPKKFLIAFSFAGAQRDLVRRVAERVEAILGKNTVFFDEWYEFWIGGGSADLVLQDVYRAKAEMAIVCISQAYSDKPWTIAEHEAIRSRKMELGASTEENARLRILPLRVGDGDVPGILFNTIAPDIRNKSEDDTAQLIINRLRLLRPDLPLGRDGGHGAAAGGASRRVFLAECTPDLEDGEKPINRGRLKAFLEDEGWEVLPAREYPVGAAEYRACVDEDLANCLAFVQLLGPYPWKPGGYDRIQNETAAARGIPRFRYRSPEINLAKIDAAQSTFIGADGVAASGFEDFKVELKSKLAVLAHKVDRPPDENQKLPPSVIVVIRSANPDPLWERIFEWVYEQEQISAQLLDKDQTLAARHAAEPCHGFLVVCDSDAMQEGPLSPRSEMEDCRLIQMKEKDAQRRPPVGLVYWPPPQPSWPRLLKSIPPKLYRILGDAPNTDNRLASFFADVRKVAE